AGRRPAGALVQARGAGQAQREIELRATLLPLRLSLATPLDRVRAEALGLAADGRSAGRRSAEAAAQVTLGEVALLQDHLDSAERHFTEGNRLSLEVGFTRKRLWSLLGLTQVAIARGQPEAARRLATEAITLTTQPDGTADVEAELHLAEACLAGADLGEAGAAPARAWAVLQEVDVFSRARLQRTEARMAAAAGDPAAAVALLERSLAALEATGHRLDQLHSPAELALALRRAGRDDEAHVAAKPAPDQAATLGAPAPGRRRWAPPPGPAGGPRPRRRGRLAPGREGRWADDPTAVPGRRGRAAPGARPEPDLPPRAPRRPCRGGRPGDRVRLPGGELPDAPGRARRPRADPDRRGGGDRPPRPRGRGAGPPRHPGRAAERRARPAQRRPADGRGAGDRAHHRLGHRPGPVLGVPGGEPGRLLGPAAPGGGLAGRPGGPDRRPAVARRQEPPGQGPARAGRRPRPARPRGRHQDLPAPHPPRPVP